MVMVVLVKLYSGCGVVGWSVTDATTNSSCFTSKRSSRICLMMVVSVVVLVNLYSGFGVLGWSVSDATTNWTTLPRGTPTPHITNQLSEYVLFHHFQNKMLRTGTVAFKQVFSWSIALQ